MQPAGLRSHRGAAKRADKRAVTSRQEPAWTREVRPSGELQDAARLPAAHLSGRANQDKGVNRSHGLHLVPDT